MYFYSSHSCTFYICLFSSEKTPKFCKDQLYPHFLYERNFVPRLRICVNDIHLELGMGLYQHRYI